MFPARDSDTIVKAGLKNGDMIYVANQGLTMTQLPAAPKEMVKGKTELEQIKKEEEQKAAEKAGKKEPEAIPEVRKDGHGRTLKAPEAKKDGPTTDNFGRVIKEVAKEPEAKQAKMIMSADEKKGDDDKYIKH